MKKTLTDDEFLDTLMELVLAEGIRNLTIGEIAARLRCSRRRLYEIAQTKEEIFCAMVDRFFRGVLDKGEALASKKRDLPAAIAAYLDEGVKAAARISVGFLTDVEESEVARACFDHYQQTRTLRLAQLVDEGVQYLGSSFRVTVGWCPRSFSELLYDYAAPASWPRPG